jgi:hypothetical protein
MLLMTHLPVIGMIADNVKPTKYMLALDFNYFTPFNHEFESSGHVAVIM